MIGNVLIGILVGLVSFAFALIAGLSFWMAMLAYTLFGCLAMLGPFLIQAWRDSWGNRAGRSAASISGLGQPDTSYMQNGADPYAGNRVPRRMRILAVDDDPFFRELVPIVSAEAGFPEVISCASGAQALDLLDRSDRPFDCFLVDISMPEMDGIELTRLLRTRPAYRTTPIIMLTSLRDMKNMDSAYRNGATDYITKPFEIAELGRRLRSASDRIEAEANRPSFDMDGQRSKVVGQAQNGQIEGISNLIEMEALASYVNRLPKAELPKVAVLAAKIDASNIQSLHRSTGRRLSIYREVAQAVGEVLGQGECLMAYGSDGILLSVSRADIVVAEDIEPRINRAIELRANRQGKGRQPHALVFVGEPVAIEGSGENRADLAFRKATVSVNDRALFSRSQLRAVRNIRAVR